MGQLVFQANAGGQTALVGPNPSTSISINIPATNGNMVTTGDSGTVTSTMLASSVYTAPGTIGSGTPNTGAFTTLSASSTVSGTGFSNYLSSPPAIGSGTPSTGSFTTLTLTNALAVNQGGTGATTGSAALSNLGGISGSSPTITTPTIATIKSAATATPTVFQDSAGTQIGTLCRAWVKYNGTTQTIIGQFNVSSVTYNGTGDFTINFTTAMPDTNYNMVSSVGLFGPNAAVRIVASQTYSTGSIRVSTIVTPNIPDDREAVSVSIFR